MTDPYVLNPKEAEKQKKELKGGSSGRICPKRNNNIGGDCKVCDHVSEIYAMQLQEDHPARKWVREHKAKANFFLNVVFPENKNKSFILEIGSKAGSAILNGVTKMGWVDIIHPKAGYGRELIINKFDDGGFNTYNPSIVGDKADWDITQEVLDNLPNLDNIVRMVSNNELTDENSCKISALLKNGESLKFRICPPAKTSVNQQKFMGIVWRHWGVSKAQIEGTSEVKWDAQAEEAQSNKNTMFDSNKQETPQGNQAQPVAQPVSYPTSVPEASPSTPVQAPVDTSNKKEPCFGKLDFYDPAAEECANCKDYKSCGRTVSKLASGEDVPF